MHRTPLGVIGGVRAVRGGQGAADAWEIAGAWPSERDDVFTSTWSSRRAGWTRMAVMLALS